MSPVKYGKVFTTVLFMVQVIMAQHVIQVPDQFPTIQEAVEHAEPNDIIEILDDGVYEEQVTIDSSKDGLTIRGNPDSKPTILWRDTKAVNPTSEDAAQDEDSARYFEENGIYFDQNGALRILKAKRVTIENIIVDGKEAFYFRNREVWYDSAQQKRFDLFHGNAAIVLWLAGDAVIKNCELKNAYFGVSVKDRNERGIFADPNPADIQLNNIVPLSGFGKTGNHLFEGNRIHSNSWGMFFESAWDLGSTIRYNLFYNNHHQTSKIESDVQGMGEEGENQIGGAILFKDDPISPVAIYNNTFYRNRICIACQWQAGAYHLVFNNIFGRPNVYKDEWRIKEFSFEMNLMDNTSKDADRYKHNLYASQDREPDPNSFDKIRSGMDSFEGSRPYSPGTKILGGKQQPKWEFSSDANNRWLEVPFKSTTASSSDFLVPDWDDPLVEEFILDQGWAAAGIRDADGSIADIGAISKSGISETSVGIKAVNPVIVIVNEDGSNANATASFNVYPINGELTDMKVKYIKWLGNLPKDPGWGSSQTHIGDDINIDRPADIQKITTPSNPISMGLNSLYINGIDQTGLYGFLEVIIEGKDLAGNTVTTNVGFLPYRELKYMFSVKLYPPDATEFTEENEITSVQVGQPVKLHVLPYRADGEELDVGEVKEVILNLVSGQTFRTVNEPDVDKRELFVDSILVDDGYTLDVIFTEIPVTGSGEIISASGTYYASESGTGEVIRGVSDEIKIMPGPPAIIKFLEQSRVSDFPSIINPGEILNSKLQIYDKFGNKVFEPADVTIESTEPEIGAPLGPTSAISDDTGVVYFDSIMVTNGGEADVFWLVATLTYKGQEVNKDTAYLKVGKITDRYVIFYSDTGGYNPTVVIEECSSERVPVTIRAIAADTIITARDGAEFSISFDKQGLVAYSSATSTEPVTRAALVDGEAVIWIQPNVPEIKDVSIEITPVGDRTILRGKRGGISFIYCDNPVKSAYYYTDYGNGTVNRVEIHFQDPLDEENIPDTMIFYWPDPSVERIVTSGMTIDSEDPSIMTVILEQPFDSLETARGTSPDLGVCIRVNEDIGSVNRQTFEIEEKVGPLLMSAIVVERLTEEGIDTLFLTFSEFVNYENLEDNSLILIKGETPITLNVLDAKPHNTEGDTIRVIVEITDNNLAPKEGDLLRINPEGPAKDNVGNFAHEDNRPVVIMQKEVPPDILSAYYYDKDGNGIVDTVIIEFNKAVKLEALSAEFTWTGKKTEKIESSDFSYVTGDEGSGNSRVAVNVSGRFQGIGVKTSENMRLNLEYSSQASAVRTVDVLDKAAPVITTAVYHPGAVTKDQPQPDTFNVTFSEKIADPESSSSPFRFYRRNANVEYEMDLKQIGISGNTIRYLVNSFSVEEVEIAENGDSVRIKVPDVYGDESGNLQNVPTNRLVPVEVKSVPLDFKVKVGPNPFIANGLDFVKIKIDPQTKMVENAKLDARVRIYDPLGNVVFDESLNNVKKVEVDWEGRNLQGRFVGSGTYLAIVEATDLNTGKKMKPSRHFIGIKRK